MKLAWDDFLIGMGKLGFCPVFYLQQASGSRDVFGFAHPQKTILVVAYRDTSAPRHMAHGAQIFSGRVENNGRTFAQWNEIFSAFHQAQFFVEGDIVEFSLPFEFPVQLEDLLKKIGPVVSWLPWNSRTRIVFESNLKRWKGESLWGNLPDWVKAFIGSNLMPPA